MLVNTNRYLFLIVIGNRCLLKWTLFFEYIKWTAKEMTLLGVYLM